VVDLITAQSSVSASVGVTNNKASKGDNWRIGILHGSSVMTATMALRAPVVPSFPPRRFDRSPPFEHDATAGCAAATGAVCDDEAGARGAHGNLDGVGDRLASRPACR
jgi:hypothetical protein